MIGIIQISESKDLLVDEEIGNAIVLGAVSYVILKIMELNMTRDDFKTAQRILNRIENIDDVIKIMSNTPFIGAERESSGIGLSNGFDKLYLSWVDNDDHGLKETILNWCKNEKDRLNKLLEEL